MITIKEYTCADKSTNTIVKCPVCGRGRIFDIPNSDRHLISSRTYTSTNNQNYTIILKCPKCGCKLTVLITNWKSYYIVCFVHRSTAGYAVWTESYTGKEPVSAFLGENEDHRVRAWQTAFRLCLSCSFCMPFRLKAERVLCKRNGIVISSNIRSLRNLPHLKFRNKETTYEIQLRI